MAAGDACELNLLESVKLEEFDVVIAATGDDKVNVVVSLLAKTEFAVPRVVARVNDPRNEWLFDENWGVDVAVSTPRMLASLVEEAVAVGDLVRLMEFRKGQANLVEITLPDDTPWGGKPVKRLDLPRNATLVTILRGPRVIVPEDDEPLEGGDELLFVATTSTPVSGKVPATETTTGRVAPSASTLTWWAVASPVVMLSRVTLLEALASALATS